MPKPDAGDLPPTLDGGSVSAAASEAASPSLRLLLERLGDCPRPSVLTLLRADQRKRWQRGERLPAEAYLAQLPASAAQQETALDIIFSEIALREEFGEKPVQDEYLRRFPQFEAALRRQFFLNRALDDASLLRTEGGTSAALPSASALAATVDEQAPTSGGTVAGEPPLHATLMGCSQGTQAAGSVNLPDYEILNELGRGGMGVVYKARQVGLKRLVALKMILAGAHASKHDLARLRGEAEAVAKLRHPHIVQIYEVGEQNGLPFLALEYIEGGNLADKLAGVPLPGPQAAFIVERLAHAMHYAHQQGIVHRDLKPANVMLVPFSAGDATTISTKVDLAVRTVETALGTPKITDFGLAKSMQGESGLTHSGAVVGTPSYMAPEQAAAESKAIGPRTDVYALGAILYELLTGRPPFRAATAVDTIVQVLNEDPVPPTQLQPKVPRDLENICLKCLQKDQTRRYASALALADDLCAFREGRPVAARPIGMWERTVKWAKRRPQIASLLAVLVVVTVVGFSTVTYEWLVARRALAETERARQEEKTQRIAKEEALDHAKASLYFNRIALAEREWSANDVLGVTKLLDNAPPDLRRWEWHYLRRLCQGGQMTLPGKDCVAISPDGKRLASAREKYVKVWDLATGKELLTLAERDGHRGRVNHVAFSADSERLASASDDGTVKLWNATTGELLQTLQPAREQDEAALPLRAVVFQPDGKRIAAAGDDDAIRLWDAATGKEVRVLAGHTAGVTALAFRSNGRVLASSSKDQTIKLWDVAKGEELRTLRNHQGAVNGVAFGPEDRLLASASEDQSVRLWDPETGQEVRTLRGHTSAVNAVAFSSASQVASASGDFLKPGEIRLWDAASGRELHVFRWPTQEITGLAFSSNGKRLGSADQRSVVVWDATNDLEARALRGHKDGVMAAAFSPTGPYLASVGEDWALKIWEVQKEEVVHECGGHTATINAVAYTPDGKRVVTASDDRMIKIWDSATGMLQKTLEGHSSGVVALAIQPNGKVLASSAWRPDQAGEVKLWELETGKEIKTFKAAAMRTLAFSPDGKRLAGGGELPFRVVTWDTETFEEKFHREDFLQPVSEVAFSPDGRWLAASGGSKQEGVIRLWDAKTLVEHSPIRTRTGRVGSIAFSPDSQRLVAASWDHTLKLFDPQTGQDVLTLRGHTDGVTGVAFSTDGWRIASTSRDKTVRLWNATPVGHR
jgi:WD40 repeat protein